MCTFITKIAIRKALRKQAPARVPLSGEEAAKNDCYIATIEAPGEAWSGWVKSSDTEGIRCRAHGVDDEIRNVSWQELREYKIEIRHYYRFFTFNYESPSKMLRWEWTGFHRWVVFREAITQYAFNRIRLARAGRVEVLRHFITTEIEKGDYKASHIDLVKDLHSLRAFGRSDVDSQMNYYFHICESLVNTGELSKNGIEYQTTSQAIATLSAYEEEERKHREMWRVQILLGVLTAGSVIASLLQAYIAYIN